MSYETNFILTIKREDIIILMPRGNSNSIGQRPMNKNEYYKLAL